MEAATPPPDPAAPPPAASAPPPPPPPDPDPDAGGQQETAPPPSEPPAEQPAATTKDRGYGIFTELKLNLKGASDRKAAMDALQKLSELTEGRISILVKVGQAMAADPRKAITNLGQVRDLDGDYEVIADSSRNKYPNVKTATRRDVSIG